MLSLHYPCVMAGTWSVVIACVLFGRRFAHCGWILILLLLDSYRNMPFSERHFESSTSLLVCMLVLFAISSILCHAPSWRLSKSSSMFNVVHYTVCLGVI